MQKSKVILFVALAVAIGVVGARKAASQKATPASKPSAALLSGSIRSASGEPMEGVTVSAKAEGKTITTSVFTDDDGVYVFPALDAGKYRVWAQAVGFVYSWSRFSAIFTSLMIGFFLNHFGVNGVFAFIAAAMLVVVLVIGVFGPRTKGLALEAIAK